MNNTFPFEDVYSLCDKNVNKSFLQNNIGLRVLPPHAVRYDTATFIFQDLRWCSLHYKTVSKVVQYLERCPLAVWSRRWCRRSSTLKGKKTGLSTDDEVS